MRRPACTWLFNMLIWQHVIGHAAIKLLHWGTLGYRRQVFSICLLKDECYLRKNGWGLIWWRQSIEKAKASISFDMNPRKIPKSVSSYLIFLCTTELHWCQKAGLDSTRCCKKSQTGHKGINPQLKIVPQQIHYLLIFECSLLKTTD